MRRVVNTTVAITLQKAVKVRSKNARFPGQSFRLSDATATVFSSGKVILVGSKSLAQIITGISEVEKMWGTVSKWTIENVVFSINLSGRLSLQETANSFGAMYSPDIFHGLVLKLCNGSTAIVYYTGKIIITGLKLMNPYCDDINNLVHRLEMQVWKHSLHLRHLEEASLLSQFKSKTAMSL